MGVSINIHVYSDVKKTQTDTISIAYIGRRCAMHYKMRRQQLSAGRLQYCTVNRNSCGTGARNRLGNRE